MLPTPRRLGKTFAAEIVGLDLRAGIDAALAEEIDQALAENGVLCFRDQPLNDEQQGAFIAHFGPPFRTQVKEIASGARHNPYFYDITNVDEEGRQISDASVRGQYLKANQLWHTDGSQIQPPIRVSALNARQLPADPPDTHYADMKAAWDALPEARQRQLEGLQAVHSMLASRAKMGMGSEAFSEESKKLRPPVTHPLVRHHARTGRKSLYLASHASHILGWPEDEGAELLAELTAFATQPEFVYVHRWRPHDLVMWDDAATMHRSTPYLSPQPRVMRWCGVSELEPV